MAENDTQDRPENTDNIYLFLENAAKQLEEAYKAAEEDKAKDEEQVATLDALIMQTESEMDDLRRKTDEYDQRLKKVKEELKQTEERLEQEKRKTEEFRDEQLKPIDAEITAKVKEAKAIMSRLEELKKTYTKIKNYVGEKKKKKEQINKEAADKIREIETTANNIIKDFAKDADNISSRTQELSTSMEQKKAEYTQLCTERDEYLSKLRHKESKLEGFKERIAHLTSSRLYSQKVDPFAIAEKVTRGKAEDEGVEPARQDTGQPMSAFDNAPEITDINQLPKPETKDDDSDKYRKALTSIGLDVDDQKFKRTEEPEADLDVDTDELEQMLESALEERDEEKSFDEGVPQPAGDRAAADIDAELIFESEAEDPLEAPVEEREGPAQEEKDSVGFAKVDGRLVESPLEEVLDGGWKYKSEDGLKKGILKCAISGDASSVITIEYLDGSSMINVLRSSAHQMLSFAQDEFKDEEVLLDAKKIEQLSKKSDAFKSSYHVFTNTLQMFVQAYNNPINNVISMYLEKGVKLEKKHIDAVELESCKGLVSHPELIRKLKDVILPGILSRHTIKGLFDTAISMQGVDAGFDLLDEINLNDVVERLDDAEKYLSSYQTADDVRKNIECVEYLLDKKGYAAVEPEAEESKQ